MKYCDNVGGDPSYFPTPLPDCLCHVSLSRYSPLSLEVVEKPNKFESFGPHFFGGMTPTFTTDGRLLSRFTVHRLAKFGWVPFADLRLRTCEAWQWSWNYTVSQKTVKNCFYQNFVKFPSILIIFGREMAKRLKLCEVHSFSTSPILRHHTTVLNADVPKC